MRLGGPGQQVTCSQDHEYTAEQLAFHHGAMDQFVEHTDVSDCTPPVYKVPGLVMGYYDGNSVTALWNYAQHYALSDNSYDTTFGPSTPGHLNLISGQTHGVAKEFMPGGLPFPAGDVVENTGNGQGTVIGDPQPFGDDCSSRDQVQLTGDNKNIGDLLNAKGVTWGYFQGGFKPTATKPDGTAVCAATHNVGAILGGTGKSGPLPLGTKDDYIPHHEPFQYYRSTANPHHLPPSQGRHDRPNRLGQPPIRPLGLLGRSRRGPPAVGELSEGPGIPRRAPRVFRSTRRATVPRRDDQPPAEAARLEGHGDRRLLRRLRRLVRPQSVAERVDIRFASGCVDRPRQVRRLRSPPATYQGRCGYGPDCRCWLSRRMPNQTSSTTHRRTRPRSCGSLRTTGVPAASVTIRSTLEPVCWTTCSPSPGPPNRRSCSTR